MDHLYALDEVELRSLIDAYPYVALYRALLARKLKDTDGQDYDEALKLAALHAPDRVRLYEFLHSPLPDLTKDDETTEQAEVHVVADQQSVVEEALEPVIGTAGDETVEPAVPVEDSDTSKEPVSTNEADQVVTTPKDSIDDQQEVEADVSTPTDPTNTNLRDRLMQSSALESVDADEKHTFLEWLDIVTQGGVPEPEAEVREESAVMDRQLAEEAAALNYEAKIQREAEAIEEEEPEEDSVEAVIAVRELADKSVSMHTGVISETLAKLMLMQGKKTEAIQLYEQLSLKYPEKSDYFAAQIRSISL